MGGASETGVGMGLIAPFALIWESHAVHHAQARRQSQKSRNSRPHRTPTPRFGRVIASLG